MDAVDGISCCSSHSLLGAVVHWFHQCDPYEEMNDEEVIQDAIRGPNRRLLPPPESCSSDVYDVMLRCWVHSPSMRADFGEIYSRLYMIYTSQAL